MGAGCRGGEPAGHCLMSLSLTLAQKVPLHADVKKVVGHILPPIFETWKTEDDR